MIETKSGKKIIVEVDDATLAKICHDVSRNTVAMDALRQGYRDIVAALERGDISSPEPPRDYIVIYKIMNSYDERYAGTLGSQVIVHLMHELLGRPRADDAADVR